MKQANTVAAHMSGLQMQIVNCIAHGNEEWLDKARKRLALLEQLLPSGSGIDSGTRVTEISDSRIIMGCSFHHMDEDGFYDGWTEHIVTARCGFYLGITVTISGSNRNEIKDYLGEVYSNDLSKRVAWNDAAQRWEVASDDV